MELNKNTAEATNFDPIAIIGIACRFPGADNLEELYKLLEEGRDEVGPITKERLIQTTLAQQEVYLEAGYLKDVDKFDYSFFKYSPIEAKSMDPNIRFSIENTYHCFENAGYRPSFFRGTNTMVVAATAGLNYYKHADEFDPTLITGNDPSFLAATISRKFDLRGNSLVVDTSCSSSVAGIQLACDALNIGRCDYALIVSTNINLFPNKTTEAGLGLDSEEGRSRSFSEKADGMSFGEGAAVILLKPYHKALKDNDHIHAVIKGIGVNNNGSLSTSPTAPDSVSQANLYAETWEMAKIDPRNLGLIEAHGSGTLLGDSIEVSGLNMAFAKYTSDKHFCSLSTIKTNFGHTRNISGIAGLLKAVLSVKKGKLFAHLHFEQPSSLIDFENSAVTIQQKLSDWHVKENEKRVAGVTCMGLSGTNFHVVVEEAAQQKIVATTPVAYFFIVVSAPDPVSLVEKMQQLENLSLEEYRLDDIGYTMLLGRDQFAHRKAGVVASKEELKAFFSTKPADEHVTPDQLRLLFLAVQTGTYNLNEIEYLKATYSYYDELFAFCLAEAEDKDNVFIIEFIAQYSFFMLLKKAGISTDAFVAFGTGQLILEVVNGSVSLREALKRAGAARSFEIEQLEQRTRALIEREKTKGFPVFIDLGNLSPITKALLTFAEKDNSFALLNTGSENNSLLAIIARWYTLGGNLDWNFIASIQPGNRIQLPLYPFKKTRCWIREKPREIVNTEIKIQQNKLLLSTANELERLIIGIWNELDLEVNTLQDNFFELGGNSLMASRMIVLLNENFHINLCFEDVFDFPTLQQLAIYIRELVGTSKHLKLIWKKTLKTDTVNDHDHFFDLGGHSLLANNLINSIQKEFGIRLNFEDIFYNPTFSELLQFIDRAISSRSDETYTEIEKIKDQENYLLSSSQFRLWMLCQFDKASVAYNEPIIVNLEGKLEIKALEYALQALIERHEILRTVFKENEHEEIRQYVRSVADLSFRIDHCDLVGAEDQRNKIEDSLSKNLFLPFNLSAGPLVRTLLIKVEREKYIFSIVMHHIITDAWSTGIIIDELLTLYRSFGLNRSILSPLKIQYRDYAAWQQKQLNGELFQKHKAYWLKQFEGELPVLHMITDKIRPHLKTYNGEIINKRIPKEITKQLKSLLRAQDCTLFMGLLGLVKTLLYRYTNQQDIVIGTPITGRSHADLEDQLGFYVNTLALRTAFKGTESFSKLVNRIKGVILGAYEHQIVPFDELVDALNLKRDLSRSPLFDVMMTFQDSATTNVKGEYNAGGLKVSEYEEEKNTSKFDLIFKFFEIDDELELNLGFNTDLFEKDTMLRMSEHFYLLLNDILKVPDKALCQLNFLSVSEKGRLLNDFNSSAFNYSKDKSLLTLFEEQVDKTPENIAIVYGDKQLNYREFNEKVNRFAFYLKKTYAIQPDDLIALMLEKSEWMMIALLGILKSGAAYVPIDVKYPEDRIEYIVSDSKCKAIINEKSLADFKGSEEIYPSHNPDIKYNLSSLAYVIYTSGSTGHPKGVMIEHNSLISYLFGFQFKHQVNLDFLFISNISFDASLKQIFLPLINGKAVHVFELTQNFHLLPGYVKRNNIEILNSTPGIITELLSLENADRLFQKMKVLIIGGEALSKNLWNKLLAQNAEIQIINAYGPTETCANSITGIVDPRLTIGTPMPNSEIYIVDGMYNIVPIGVMGEICIGGEGLARGYLNRPDLTNEKFIENPFKNGKRMYVTGDYGRWLTDGYIEFFGRKDDQIKIRGHRVEIAEIESALRSDSKIREAVVLVKNNEKGEPELIAYIVLHEKTPISLIQAGLIKKIPRYMLPSYFVQLDTIPITANGKVDKNALFSLRESFADEGVEYVGSRNEIEKDLMILWEDILGKKKISVKDDFFELGGHSLKAVRLLSKIHKKFEAVIELKDIFSKTVFEEQALLISAAKKITHVSIPSIAAQTDYVLSSSQRRLWILNKLDEGNAAYNISAAYMLDGELDINAMGQAFQCLVTRHEILRTVFRENNSGEIRQIIHDENSPFDILYTDLRLSQNQDEEALNLVKLEMQHTFDLATGPLIRASLLQLKDKAYVLAFTMHHIISDGWSMGIVFSELLAFYHSAIHASEHPFKPLNIQYKDFASWQQETLKKDELLLHKQYWLKQMGDTVPILNFPTDRKHPAIKTYKGNAVTVCLGKVINKEIKKICKEQGGTLFMGLLAAINTLLYKYTGQQDIIVGSPIAGREHADLDDQIGFYVNTLPLRTKLAPEESFNNLLQATKQVMLDAYKYQAYPFDELVGQLDLQRDMSRNALFDVMLILQNTYDRTFEKNVGNALNIKAYDATESLFSKFDLSFNFVEIEEALYVGIEYSTDIFAAETITRLADHMQQLFAAIVKNPDELISKLDILTEADKYKVISEFNAGNVSYPANKTIIELFEEQVQKGPDAIALVSKGKKLSYRELNEQANALAAYLKDTYSVERNERVALKLERDEWIIVALIGILKTGAAYVPIDPDFPVERIDYMIQDSNCRLVIDKHELKKFILKIPELTKKNPEIHRQGADPAYVIYTSGSTGKPKGVVISNISIIDYCYGLQEKTTIHDCQSFGFVSTIAADLGNTVVYPSLLMGKELHVFSEEEVRSPEYMAQVTIDCLKIVPGHWKALQGEKMFAPVKTLIFGGEQLTPDVIRYIKDNQGDFEVYNHYGPTETTIGKLIKQIDLRSHESKITLGHPIGNSKVYILDPYKNAQPLGVSGEIYIGGAGLALGYLNNPELTQEKFISNPFLEGELIYKTGDLGKRSASGEIEFIGRIDNQVKIKGYRIELDEIEKSIQAYSKIETAVVLVNEQGDERELIAYLVQQEELNVAELRNFLGQSLPFYMIPAQFIAVDELPITLNGKVDKKKLLELKGTDVSSGIEYLAPVTEVEQAVIAVFEDVLKKHPIGMKDDFFVHGGDSIKSIQIVSRLRQKGYELAIRDILLHPVIEDIMRRVKVASRFIDQEMVEGIIALNPIQSAFFSNKKIGQKHHYNQSVLLNINGEVSVEGLKAALDKIVLHHDALRMVYHKANDSWVQENKGKEQSYSFELLHVTGEGDFNSNCDRIQSSIDLENGPLFKVALFIQNEKSRLLMVAHHLIIDGVSWRTLFDDLSALYSQYQTGSTLLLPMKTYAFRDWVSEQLNYAKSDMLLREESYWAGIESQAVQHLPVDHATGIYLKKNAHSQSFTVDKDSTLRLTTKSYRAYSTEINEILITGLGLAVNEVFHLDKLLIKLEGHGREFMKADIDVTRTIGWFTIKYPVLVDLNFSNDTIRQLIEVKECLHRVPNKGMGYGMLRYLMGRNYKLEPEITFNYLGDFGEGVTNTDGNTNLFEFSDDYKGENVSKEMEKDGLLDISGIIIKGELQISMEYSTDQFTERTIKSLIYSYRKHLMMLIEKLSIEEKVHITPVDLTYKGLSLDEIEQLNASLL